MALQKTCIEQVIEANQVNNFFTTYLLIVLFVDMCTADSKGTAGKQLQSSTDVFATSVLP